MKPKNLEKKLVLNKKTIANLKNEKMNNVLGGYYITYGNDSCGNTQCYSVRVTICQILSMCICMETPDC